MDDINLRVLLERLAKIWKQIATFLSSFYLKTAYGYAAQADSKPQLHPSAKLLQLN